MRIQESQSKITFRDFSKPVHNGKKKFDVGSSLHSRSLSKDKGIKTDIDLISHKVQSHSVERQSQFLKAQEKVSQLQAEVAK